MISNIKITNFKGFASVDLGLSRLNIFVGENGTGKSTIAHALSILKKSMGSAAINTDLPYTNLGSIDRLVPAGQSATILVGGTENANLKAPFVNEPVTYSVETQFDSQGLLTYETWIGIGQQNQKTIHNFWARYGDAKTEPAQLNLFDINFNIQATPVIGQAFQLGGYGIPQGKQKEANQIYESLVKLSNTPAQVLQKIVVVPVFRGFLEPSYPLLPATSPESNIRAAMSQMGAGVASNLAYLDPKSKLKIREWMKSLMDVEIDWRLVQGGQVVIFNAEKDTYFVNEGFGTNQVTFIFAELARAQQGSLIIIEEPEIHLHPKAQFKFGELISQIAVGEKIQIILNTHSEQVLSGVLNSIRRSKAKPNDVSVWLFEKSPSGNIAKKCTINPNGTTDEGLRTFIEASVTELKEFIA
jgi:ABC-type dipeptide/oligopeptide/nickel transport system ATPase component